MTVNSPLSGSAGAADSAASPHRHELAGVIAAVITPFTKELRPDLGRMKDLCDVLLRQGCDALGVLGTTGEAATQGIDDRIAVMEGLVERGIAGDRLLPGTGAGNLADTVRLTRAALAAGATRALVVPPWFFKGVSDDGLFAFYAELIERVGDPRLRVYLYHIPQNTGVPFSIEVVGRLLARYPIALAGLKDSSGNWNNMAALLREYPGFGMFSGTEQYLLDTLRAGGPGCIAASVNVTAPLAARVYRAWQAGRLEEAQRLQDALTTARLALQAFPFQSGMKALIADRTGDAEWARLMPPLTPLSDEQRDAELAVWKKHSPAMEA